MRLRPIMVRPGFVEVIKGRLEVGVCAKGKIVVAAAAIAAVIAVGNAARCLVGCVPE